jgi:hypothetical protein
LNTLAYAITREPRYEMYHQLVDYSLVLCDHFLLVLRDSISVDKSAENLMDELGSFLTSDEELSEWPGTKLYDSTARVIRFSLTLESASILKSAVSALYEWAQPEFPEDLCFVRRSGKPWLITISHEKFSYLEMTEKEKDDFIKNVPSFTEMLQLSE